MIVVEPETFRIVAANKAYLEKEGLTPGEVVGKTCYEVTHKLSEPCMPPDHKCPMYETVKTGKTVVEEHFHCDKKGERYWAEIITAPLFNGEKRLSRVLHISRDITERKLAEEALKESEEKFRTIAASAHDSIIMEDDEGRVSYWNRAAEEMFGYSAAEAAGKALHELIIPKRYHKDYLRGFKKFRETGQGPAIGKTLCLTAVRRDGAEFQIELSLSAIKVRDRWNAIGVVRDITERKQMEEELSRSLARLRSILGGVIQALASTIEARDPYTSGHQRRVANLARAIATEMGLSQEKIEGVRIAGLVHDIGKITIPAEILSKPGKLTEAEMDMVRTHPQVGYDILKEIEFPWPVAQIVLQHQERMDGSGYPAGLKGDEIILEARILAVADVVEAMSFHRPYRPAYGIDEALKEISRNRIVLYDPDVVDACVRLFKEKGFRFR